LRKQRGIPREILPGAEFSEEGPLSHRIMVAGANPSSFGDD